MLFTPGRGRKVMGEGHRWQGGKGGTCPCLASGQAPAKRKRLSLLAEQGEEKQSIADVPQTTVLGFTSSAASFPQDYCTGHYSARGGAGRAHHFSSELEYQQLQKAVQSHVQQNSKLPKQGAKWL